MKAYIYAIKNLANNKMYIGSTKFIKNRQYEHFRTLSKGNHHSPYLQKSYNKYGKDKFAFYLLEECTSENRKERELYYITFYKTFNRDFGYNVYEPDENKFKCSIETIAKIKRAKVDKFTSVDVYKTSGEFLSSHESINECARVLAIRMTIISQILLSKRKSYKGLTFTKKGEPFNYKPSKMARDMEKFIK